jgi:MSHA biogenesis protein MshJ
MANKLSWQQLNDKFIVLTEREQYLISLTGIVAVVMVMAMLVIEPIYTKLAKIERQNNDLLAHSQQLTVTIDAANQKLAQDPNLAVRSQIETQLQKLVRLDSELAELTNEIISPKQMSKALTQLLAFDSGVKLLSLEALPAERLNQDTAKDAQADGPLSQADGPLSQAEGATVNDLVLYRHGIKLVLNGSYQQLYDYLELVEQLPWRFFWREFYFQRQQYPKAELELELYSISTAKEFIGV